MSDDIWRQDDAVEGGSGGRRPGRYESEMDEFDDEEFGGPLFGGDDSGGEAEDEGDDEESDDDEAESGTALSFGDDESGALPHWTEPPTGEMPKIESTPAGDDPTDDLDVWSSFTTESPVWQEGDSVDQPSGRVGPTSEPASPEAPADPTGELSWEDAPAEAEAAEAARVVSDDPADVETGDTDTVTVGEAQREPARITIGTDPSGMPRRPDPARRGSTPQRPPSSGPQTPGSDSRNLPIAVFTGLLLAAVFLALALWRPAGAVAFVTVALGVAGLEYFGRVTEKGYRPAVASGVAAIVAAPLAAYWVGELGLPLVIVFAFIAGALAFIFATSIESGPMPNMAITTLGIVWIGLMGSYAALILRLSTVGFENQIVRDKVVSSANIGTDTLILIAIGVVANDVGAYFVGSAFGRTPLRAWISPGKSVEGLIGGTLLTLIVMVIVGLRDLSDTWVETGHLLGLGVVISIAAPLGDLTESMFKRNLDVKDFGTIIRGHGGVLDRFDGFLFTLPLVYYFFLVFEPFPLA